ncbi:hypothetical protein NDU88_007348 [Pleurodeles waltl]|uniref:Retrotransposon gag domain-containing protein n=1 Tax=Pleurodeles waltl TaxID=8319 RepID=A0AAV7NWF4_PLEWA|nr:hypothetical protein NDU88_007348 [Pleurodeles waltl]
MYFVATTLDNDHRHPMLLHLGGAAIHKISKSVNEEGPPFTYQYLKSALTAHFEPLANPDYERFLLRQARQPPEESVHTFYARLWDLASTCTLPDVEDELQAQFIQGCYLVKLRENILQAPVMSMANMLTLGRSRELSKMHAAHMEAALQKPVKAEPVNAVATAHAERRKSKQTTNTMKRTCYTCGGSYPHQGQCLAQGKRCTNCNKLNHFTKVCRSTSSKTSKPPKTRQAAQIHTSDDQEGDMDDDESEGTVHVIHAMQPGGSLWKRIPKCNIQVVEKLVVALIDTGASINIMALQVMKPYS